jgi:cobalt/nickel transport system ATP-binding protein
VSASPILELAEVSVRYGSGAPAVLDGVTFSLAAGERAALVGLNGSGKTTLLMAAVGLVAHGGSVRVYGTPVTRETVAHVRRQTGFLFNVPEDQLLFPTALEDVAFALVQRGVGRERATERARAMLAELGVGALADLPLSRLSHGQKQRVALAGALVSAPPLVLLDEPSAGLDPPGKVALARLLAALDAAVLVATHDLDFAARLCSRFIVLDAGSIAYDGGDLSSVVRRWEMSPSGSGTVENPGAP